MKKLLLFIILLTLLPIQFTVAQDAGTDNVLMVGARYDDKPYFTFGYARSLGGAFWGFAYGDFGEKSGNMNTEVAALFNLGGLWGTLKNLYVGPVAGPNADWVNQGEPDLINYINGAAGIAASYAFTDKFGLCGMAKYKFAVVDDNLYPDGWMVGIAGWLGFGT
jgi:hypothetical protein